MFEELSSASEQLRTALERYLHICSSIQDFCLQGTTPRSILPDYAQRVDLELGLAESYDTTMQKAKHAIKSTRNHAFSIAPINCLPPEILMRIFQIARDDDPCHVDQLALVCSRWRSVSLSSPSLWSHIDYHPHVEKWFYPDLVEKAQLRFSRSREAPVDFYLSVSSELYNNNCYDSPVERLCELVAPRMRSLHLDLEGFVWPVVGTNSVLSTLFSNCTVGTLTKLVTMDPDHFGFITATEGARASDSLLRVRSIHGRLEKTLSSITVLHLTGLFPQWTSYAYRNLIDLRLCAAPTGVDSDNMISEGQLVKILKASPGLLILHFELQITYPGGERIDIAPRVHLADLEVLHVRSNHGAGFTQIEHLLRLIKPGPKPLHISIQHFCLGPDTEVYAPETKAFFTRSHVTKLYVSQFPLLAELLPLLPHLKVLIMSGQTRWPQPSPATSTYPRLDACFLLDCSLPLDGFLALIRHCRPNTLTLFRNEFYRSGPKEKVDMEIVEKELSTICPDVRIPEASPSLAEHQDLLYDD